MNNANKAYEHPSITMDNFKPTDQDRAFAQAWAEIVLECGDPLARKGQTMDDLTTQIAAIIRIEVYHNTLDAQRRGDVSPIMVDMAERFVASVDYRRLAQDEVNDSDYVACPECGVIHDDMPMDSESLSCRECRIATVECPRCGRLHIPMRNDSTVCEECHTLTCDQCGKEVDPATGYSDASGGHGTSWFCETCRGAFVEREKRAMEHFLTIESTKEVK